MIMVKPNLPNLMSSDPRSLMTLIQLAQKTSKDDRMTPLVPQEIEMPYIFPTWDTVLKATTMQCQCESCMKMTHHSEIRIHHQKATSLMWAYHPYVGNAVTRWACLDLYEGSTTMDTTTPIVKKSSSVTMLQYKIPYGQVGSWNKTGLSSKN